MCIKITIQHYIPSPLSFTTSLPVHHQAPTTTHNDRPENTPVIASSPVFFNSRQSVNIENVNFPAVTTVYFTNLYQLGSAYH